jgi:2-haloacid dehalogenase
MAGLSWGITCRFSNLFYAREGQSLYNSNKPDFVANDILAMAEKLVATYTR